MKHKRVSKAEIILVNAFAEYCKEYGEDATVFWTQAILNHLSHLNATEMEVIIKEENNA